MVRHASHQRIRGDSVSSYRDRSLVAISAGGYIVGLRADGRVLVLGGTEVGKSDLSTWVLAVPQSDEARVWVGADLRTLDAVPVCRAKPTEQAEPAPPTEQEIQTLLAALKSGGTPAERIAAARALGKTGDPRAVEPLGIVLSENWHLYANGMRENSPGVHKAAAQALAKIGGLRAVELLGISLRREGNIGAGDDAEALGRIGSPAAEEQLRAARNLEHSYGWVRSDIVKALGVIRERRAKEQRKAERMRRQNPNA